MEPAPLRCTDRGLYCAAGDFYVDPWKPVERAVITHGHMDHAQWGCRHYLCTPNTRPILEHRLSGDFRVQAQPYGEPLSMGGARVTFFPAGHILGSAQVRVEQGGQSAVVSGDYKTEPDPSCEPFEPVACHHFVSECTFGLPVYRWRPQDEVLDAIRSWWAEQRERGRNAVLLVYALGKAQRILRGLLDEPFPVLGHGSITRLTPIYEGAGIPLHPIERVTPELAGEHEGRALVLAPPSVVGTPWLRKLGPYSLAMASGWMQVRGHRRRRALDRGFVLSDHADWDGLLATVRQTGAERVWFTHGSTSVMARWFNEQGTPAEVLKTTYGEDEETDASEETP